MRLVAKGFALKEGIEYDEIFTPIVKWAIIHSLLVMSDQHGWKVHQMDMKIAFLNDYLKENVYMK